MHATLTVNKMLTFRYGVLINPIATVILCVWPRLAIAFTVADPGLGGASDRELRQWQEQCEQCASDYIFFRDRVDSKAPDIHVGPETFENIG